MTETAIRIVVGDDLTEPGENALATAFRLATNLQAAELHAVHVLPTRESLHSASKLETLADQMTSVEERLRERVIESMTSNGAETELDVGFHVRLGDIAGALHQLAVDYDADVIVVGTHRRGGLAKLVLGSVAQELTQSARVPVLIAHPKDYSGLRPSVRPDAPRSEDLESGLSTRGRLQYRGGTAHIAGLV
jgi:nucleotide-binding universal stress UspA family protein